MKTRKSTQKTTIHSLINDLNRWYGSGWWKSGIMMLGVALASVILPGIFG